MTCCPFCGGDPTIEVSHHWSIESHLEIHSANDRIVNAGPKQGDYAKERKAWVQQFMAARMNLKIPKATAKRRVTLIRRYTGKQRAFDYGNLVAGFKPVLDAMVTQTLLKNDNPDLLEDHYQQLRWTASGTIILIEEPLYVCQ